MRGSDQRATHPGRNLVAGGLAGCFAKSLVAPLDRMKILYQGNHGIIRGKTIPSAIVRVYQEEGLLAFWRGNKPQMARIFPYAGVQFLTFERAKRFYRQQFGDRHFVSFMAGSTAGITAVTVTYPIDFLRTRMAWTVGHPVTVLELVREIHRTEGKAAFYRGIVPTYVGMLFYAGVSFGIYDFIKHSMLAVPQFQSTSGPEHLNTLANLICGGTAGLISQTIAYPFDVVRRRMQIEQRQAGQNYQFHGVFQSMRLLYSQGGLRMLFRGISLNYIREFPQVGLAFVAYEKLKIWLEVYKDSDEEVAVASLR
ncbi:uncharacterized protein MONBRDRAFT_32514 [Monosiga brevicollis MX1]|uniref:Uncharacterized protein n=1 Tax=Monosiga brevicollis TaxID=81824 RepID=A9V005_MONBE|nr:uncharacterized protein MONBRDRAFT_32514 [Monosiga brevicollis MX1]EDQ88927.1 predicted protein [Monosiga brevicollis MX1]|eukprot:XP_001746032.1 hypothetical protein [Monosiga brevicollis MX1]